MFGSLIISYELCSPGVEKDEYHIMFYTLTCCFMLLFLFINVCDF